MFESLDIEASTNETSFVYYGTDGKIKTVIRIKESSDLTCENAPIELIEFSKKIKDQIIEFRNKLKSRRP